MHVIEGVCFEENYKKILNLILSRGSKRDVRGFNTIELSPFCYRCERPLNNLLLSPVRNINKAFAVAEMLWMLSGKDELEMVEFYNSNIRKFSDDGKTLSGAYGPRLKPQLDYVVQTLKLDKYSRQAVVSLWKSCPTKSKDIPCTLTMQFLVNNNDALDMIVTMRSNDAWLGLPYDFFSFTTIQNYVSMLLGLNVGYYTHFVGSEHLYVDHVDKARELISKPTYVKDVYEGRQFTSNCLSAVVALEQKMRKQELIDHRQYKDIDESWDWILMLLSEHIEKKIKKHCTK